MRTHLNRALWQKLYRWFYRNHDEVICQSRYMRDDLVENYRYPVSRTRVINNPVDVDRILSLAMQPAALPAIEANSVVLVAAGRLDPEKGFDLLIDAFALLDRAELHLVILGEGPLEADLKRRAKTSGADERIHFAGFQANPFAWFARANAFVLSSHYEGFPNVVLEALACGTPVIATPAPGGTREILDGIEGCEIAAEVSAPALSEAIASWLSGPRRKIDASVVDRYRVERIVREYEAALSKDPRT
jgi:glycosyltransferase involved in cell wall biosynthesis